MIWKPWPYQNTAIQHMLQRDVDPRYAGDWADNNSGNFLDMGLGKTVCALTVADTLMFDRAEINRAIVIAPRRVAEDTWTDEIAKWDHLRGMRVSKIIGNEKKRIAAIKTKADLYIVSRDNLVWLCAQLGGAWPYDFVIIDELSSFKNWSSARSKALRKVIPLAKRVAGLTGTPAANGLIDLHPQIYLLDRGQRLGKTITSYREAYFKEPFRQNGIPVASWRLAGDDPNDIEKNPNAKIIFDNIKDLCISMKAEDWLDVPKRIDIINNVHLSPAVLARYKDFQKKQVLALDDAEDLTMPNANALANKLLQFANGAVYVDNKHNYVEVHNEKIEALGERLEMANGNPVMIFYSFQSDVPRIQKHLKEFKPRLLKTSQDLRDWNAGKIGAALAHPASFGHGLNLQFGGHLIEWFGRPWSLEIYLQALTRIHRQGQVKGVISDSLACVGTSDFKVIESNINNESGQNALMRAMKAIIKEVRMAA